MDRFPHTWFIHVLCLMVVSARAEVAVTAGQIPVSQQVYDHHKSSRCRLLTHQSTILQNGDHYILVVDGGYGLFRTQLNGQTVQVTDLNPYTIGFALSENFTTTNVEPLWQYKKPYNGSSIPPVTNNGALWASMDQNSVYIQGGHFYHGNLWSSSAYFVSKSNIPEWTMWKMDVRNHHAGWSDVTAQVVGHEVANRTFAGIAASITNDTRHFWIGGLIDSTTSATTPNNTMQSTNQMLEYDESSKKITRSEYYSSSSTDGYWQGDLVHLPVGPGKGYLISLMSLTHTTTTSWVDQDGESGNFEIGKAVTLETIPLYDLDTNTWFQQTADFFNNELPEPRTRFCLALFHDAVDNTWHLWMYGGQKLSDQNEGVSDVYVLNMPSFIWTKVETTLPSTNLIRSHTCHAVGGQLLIVGGHPPAVNISINTACDSEYIKILRIGEESVDWTGTFSTNTTYRTPLSVQNVENGRRVPFNGFANDKLARDFNHTISEPKSINHKAPLGAIVGGTVGGVFLVVLIIVIFCWYKWPQTRPRPVRQLIQWMNRPPPVIHNNNTAHDMPILEHAAGVPTRPSHEARLGL